MEKLSEEDSDGADREKNEHALENGGFQSDENGNNASKGTVTQL